MRVAHNKISQEKFERIINENYNGEFKVLGEYKSRKEKVLVYHETCKREFPMLADSLLKGRQCFKCSYSNRKSTKPKSNKKFLDEVFKKVGDEYTFLEEYVNNKHKLLVRHNKCKNTYHVSPNKFLSLGRRCPYCKEESRGEALIHKWLHENKIKHKREVTFKGCKDVNLLPFDFLIKSNNKYLVIEFDGKQHFEPSFVSCPKQAKVILEKTQYHDKIKTEYLQEKNIPLLRIHYKDINNIPQILDNYFMSNDYYVLLNEEI